MQYCRSDVYCTTTPPCSMSHMTNRKMTAQCRQAKHHVINFWNETNISSEQIHMNEWLRFVWHACIIFALATSTTKSNNLTKLGRKISILYCMIISWENASSCSIVTPSWRGTMVIKLCRGLVLLEVCLAASRVLWLTRGANHPMRIPRQDQTLHPGCSV